MHWSLRNVLRCLNTLISCDEVAATMSPPRNSTATVTLILIEDTNADIVGGFPPVEWRSHTQSLSNKGNGSLQSSLFTLAKPRGCRRGHSHPRLERRKTQSFALPHGLQDVALVTFSFTITATKTHAVTLVTLASRPTVLVER
jgi:hypothetical protein